MARLLIPSFLEGRELHTAMPACQQPPTTPHLPPTFLVPPLQKEKTQCFCVIISREGVETSHLSHVLLETSTLYTPKNIYIYPIYNLPLTFYLKIYKQWGRQACPLSNRKILWASLSETISHPFSQALLSSPVSLKKVKRSKCFACMHALACLHNGTWKRWWVEGHTTGQVRQRLGRPCKTWGRLITSPAHPTHSSSRHGMTPSPNP